MSDVLIVMNRSADRLVNDAIRRGLKAVGMKAEGYAKMLAPVDTGLLRNSITFALGGEMPDTTEYTDDNGGNEQTYGSPAPADEKGNTTLYVGTNVHYAPYQELGHMTAKGDWIDPQAFLRPAMENHAEEYQMIIAKELSAIK